MPICFSAYDYVIEPRGKVLAKTDIQIALPDGMYRICDGVLVLKYKHEQLKVHF